MLAIAFWLWVIYILRWVGCTFFNGIFRQGGILSLIGLVDLCWVLVKDCVRRFCGIGQWVGVIFSLYLMTWGTNQSRVVCAAVVVVWLCARA